MPINNNTGCFVPTLEDVKQCSGNDTATGGVSSDIAFHIADEVLTDYTYPTPSASSSNQDLVKATGNFASKATKGWAKYSAIPQTISLSVKSAGMRAAKHSMSELKLTLQFNPNAVGAVEKLKTASFMAAIKLPNGQVLLIGRKDFPATIKDFDMIINENEAKVDVVIECNYVTPVYLSAMPSFLSDAPIVP